MTLAQIRADIMHQIAVERAARRSTHGLEVLLQKYTHRDLRQAPMRAGREKQRRAA